MGSNSCRLRFSNRPDNTQQWCSRAGQSSFLRRETANPFSSPERTGGPKTRHVIGRAAYKSHAPVVGSSAGQGSSFAKSANRSSASSSSFKMPVCGSPGKLPERFFIDCCARLRICAARRGSVASSSASPWRSRIASSWLMAKGPWQHCVQPLRQTSHSPLLRAASARATSTICMSLLSDLANELGTYEKHTPPNLPPKTGWQK
jgi:hypothetical protein